MAALPIIIGFIAGCNLTALCLAPWSWLLATQFTVWLLTLWILLSIQRKQAANRRA